MDFSRFRVLALIALLSLTAHLSGCGGGDPSPQANARSGSATVEEIPDKSGALPVDIEFAELMTENAQLNAEELQLAQELADTSATESFTEATTKAVSTLTPIYRFLNTRTSAHFFTAKQAERDSIRANLPYLRYEGIAFYASSTPARGLHPVYRFYNTQTGVHLYTISENEKANIIKSIPVFRYEGIAYYASQVTASGTSSLRRFLVRDRGFHFYSSSVEEANRIRATLPNYVDEGPAYYALTAAWENPIDVDLTAGAWVLTSRDIAGTSWTGSTLLFTKQTADATFYNVEGYFDFLRNGSPRGREYFTGQLYGDGRLVLSGYLVTDSRIVPTDYLAFLSVAGNEILKGQWGRPGNSGTPGTWTAAR